MWIYRAYDEGGLPIGEAYRKKDLVDKLLDEFGPDKIYIIKRVFERWVK